MKYLRKIILVMLLAFTASSAIADDAFFTVDGFSYAITSTTDLTVEVIEGPDEAVVTVPSTVVLDKRTFRVIGIGSEAFRYHENLTSVDMPSATSIGNGAFKNCVVLTSVNLPSATSIGNGAFSNCVALTSVNLPAATSIGDLAFYKCDALTSVNLPAATSIGNEAFNGCDALTSVNLPAATSIGGSAFYGCDALTSVNLPAAMSIGGSAFFGCKALTSVSLPAATSIGGAAFGGCKALTSVSLPAATSIGQYAFYGCDSLTSVNLPAATSIGVGAFSFCEALSDIYVGRNPADCFSSPFEKVTYATATLHVPAECASKYKAAEYWKQFAFITEDYDPTGIKNANTEKVKVLCENGNVNITGLKNGMKVEFYSVNGQLLAASVANSGAVSFKTSERIVICKIAGTSIKVHVK